MLVSHDGHLLDGISTQTRQNKNGTLLNSHRALTSAILSEAPIKCIDDNALLAQMMPAPRQPMIIIRARPGIFMYPSLIDIPTRKQNKPLNPKKK